MLLRTIALLLVSASCASSDSAVDTTSDSVDSGCADVVDVFVEGSGGTYRFDVTVSSDETGWDKYSDAFEVRTPDGGVLGTRVLLHPHVEEQPFTRSLTGVEIPSTVTHVVVLARDSVLGFCGAVVDVELPA